MVYFCPEGGGERGRETVRDREREREGVPLSWMGNRRRGRVGGERRGFGGVRKVTEAERSFVFVLIKTCWVSTEFYSR